MAKFEIPVYNTYSPDVTVCDTYESVMKLGEIIKSCGNTVAVDTETYYNEDMDIFSTVTKTINNSQNNKPFCLTLTVKDNGRYVSYFVKEDDIPLCRDWLEDEEITKIFHNAKYDLHMLKNIGITVNGTILDTMLMIHLIDEEHMCRTPAGKMVESKTLKNLAYHYLDEEAKVLEELVDETRKVIAKNNGWAKSAVSYKDVYDALPRAMIDYACKDTEFTYKLYEIFIVELQRQGLEEAYKVDINATLAVFDMERNGVKVDMSYYKNLDDELLKKIASIDKRVDELLINSTANINSAADIVKMFGNIGVRWEWFTDKKSPQTNDTVLKTIANTYSNKKAVELANLILERRELTKLSGTFVAQMFRFVQKDGKLHPDFNICPREERDKTVGATVTGRLSSSNPNFQNIPKDDKRVRKGIVPSTGFFLAELDYSQQEYRLLGAYAGDRNFSEIIHQGKDIHTGTAEMMLGISHEEAKLKKNRDIGKKINFALVYGLGSAQFAANLGYKIDISLYNRGSYLLRTFGYKPWQPYPTVENIISANNVTDANDINAIKYYFSEEPTKSIADAMEMKDVYFRQFPMIQVFLNACKDRTKARGYCKTWTGRRRHFKKAKEEAYKAPNACIQGGCGDITKTKMFECMKFLEPYKTRAVNNIHDAILFEVANDEVFLLDDLKRILTDLNFSVPFDCSIEVGAKSWAEMTEVSSAMEAAEVLNIRRRRCYDK